MVGCGDSFCEVFAKCALQDSENSDFWGFCESCQLIRLVTTNFPEMFDCCKVLLCLQYYVGVSLKTYFTSNRYIFMKTKLTHLNAKVQRYAAQYFWFLNLHICKRILGSYKIILEQNRIFPLFLEIFTANLRDVTRCYAIIAFYELLLRNYHTSRDYFR
eukprot:TRINITY_DN2342_c0_g1_i1.p1 TRINITY_DN2342_c0_g1~~TRINITY_DN2342_c0_g1_i1.p1  ORF type:complete len:159 (-),score=7.29 TRINITY_DN2342_c0_g1_i1:43-519(-)